MATHAELFDLYHDELLKNNVSAGNIIVALAIAQGDPPIMAERKAWAKATLQNPATAADHMLVAVIAANKDLTKSEISGLSDPDIITAITDAVVAFE